MTKKKSTKRALISSLLVLAMCFTMLAGTTFAWFTDSVTSGNNIIKSGKLDMVVEYTTDFTNWTEVTSATKLFNDNALWEPGYAQVAYIRVRNAGNLALKYKLAANIVSETAGVSAAGEFKLSDYLKFGTVAVQNVYTDRADAIAAVEQTATALKGATLADGTTLEVGQTGAPVAIVIYMPTTVGNEANYTTTAPEIVLGLNAVATQKDLEPDGFGIDYDAAATYPVLPESNGGSATIAAADIAAGTTVAATETSIGYNIPANTAFEDDQQSPATDVKLNVDLVAAEDGSATYDISFKDATTGAEVEPSDTVSVTLYIGKNLSNVKVYHEGNLMTSGVAYDATTGMLTITSDSFSPFKVTFDAAEYAASVNGTRYASFVDALTAGKGGDTIYLESDVTPEGVLNVNGKMHYVIDLNGHTLTIDLNKVFAYVLNGNLEFTGNGTIETVNNVDGKTYCAIEVYGDADEVADLSVLKIGKGVTIKGNVAYAIGVFGLNNVSADGVNVTIDGKVENSNCATISGNIQQWGSNPAVLTVGENAVVSDIYAAGYGIYNIYGKVSGSGNGIGIKAGKLNVYGTAEITADGEPAIPPESWNNGINDSGCAIQIESNNGYAGAIEINVASGAKITSEKAYAIYEYLATGTAASKIVSYSVSDGAVLSAAMDPATSIVFVA